MATTPRKQIGGVVKLNHPNFNEIGSRVRPPDAQISSKSDDFCRAIICKRGLCRHAVSVCLSIMFVNSVETNKHVLELFSPSVSHTTLVFQYQTSWQYSDGNSTNGGVECRWGRKTLRSHHLSQYLAPLCAVNDSTAKCNKLSCNGPWQVHDTSRW